MVALRTARTVSLQRSTCMGHGAHRYRPSLKKPLRRKLSLLAAASSEKSHCSRRQVIIMNAQGNRWMVKHSGEHSVASNQFAGAMAMLTTFISIHISTARGNMDTITAEPTTVGEMLSEEF